MSTRALAAVPAVAIIFGSLALGAEVSPPRRVSFSAKPKAIKAGGEVKISFAVDGGTDVEVAVLDANGKIVRHLVAGALGAKKDPPAPLKAGLSQTVTWDGKDDYGVKAKGAPFKARVRLGLKPTFSHLIGESRQTHGIPMGLGCDAKGNLHVMYRWGMSSTHYVSMGIKVYDRDGKYLRRMVPYAADLPAEKRPALGYVGPFKDGPAVPLLFIGHSRSLYPQIGAGGLYARVRHSVLFRSDGKLVTTTYPDRDPSGMKRRRIVVFGPNGGAGKDFLGPQLTELAKDRSRGRDGGTLPLALSPDGKTIYLTGGIRKGAPNPVVFRTSWDNKDKPEAFVGDAAKPGSGPAQFIEPRGIATDAQGNVYVADIGNNRVAVFSSAGKPIAQIPVRGADVVLVHPKTGAVYAIGGEADKRKGRKYSYFSGEIKLFKFKDYKSTKPVAEMVIGGKYGMPIACLDATAEPAVVWLARLRYGAYKVVKVVDKGTSFEDGKTPMEAAKAKSEVGWHWLDLMVDASAEEVWAKEGGYDYRKKPMPKRYEGRTGKYLGSTKFKVRMAGGCWGEGVFGLDGQSLLYATAADKHAILKRDGSMVKQFGPLPGGHIHSRGAAVGPDGSYYVLHHRGQRDSLRGVVSQVSATGEILRKEFIKVDAPVGGIKVDLKGNVYVGAHIKPKGELLPAWFEGKLPDEQARWYTDMYGSILKFKPSAGGLEFGDGDLVGVGNRKPFYKKSLKADGLLWAYHGIAPISSRRVTRCICQLPRFDVDPYGRVWVPDVFRFSVRVIDNSTNPIARFGSYGNEDSRGPGGPIKTPEIPLGWAPSVQVTDDYAYMADVMNHRVVAVKLTSTAEETCAIK